MSGSYLSCRAGAVSAMHIATTQTLWGFMTCLVCLAAIHIPRAPRQALLLLQLLQRALLLLQLWQWVLLLFAPSPRRVQMQSSLLQITQSSFLAFGEIAELSTPGVQGMSLDLGKEAKWIKNVSHSVCMSVGKNCVQIWIIYCLYKLLLVYSRQGFTVTPSQDYNS